MTIKELEAQLLALTPIDKTEAISILTQSLKNSGRPITKTPGVMGGDACIPHSAPQLAHRRIEVVKVNYPRSSVSKNT